MDFRLPKGGGRRRWWSSGSDFGVIFLRAAAASGGWQRLGRQPVRLATCGGWLSRQDLILPNRHSIVRRHVVLTWEKNQNAIYISSESCRRADWSHEGTEAKFQLQTRKRGKHWMWQKMGINSHKIFAMQKSKKTHSDATQDTRAHSKHDQTTRKLQDQRHKPCTTSLSGPTCLKTMNHSLGPTPTWVARHKNPEIGSSGFTLILLRTDKRAERKGKKDIRRVTCKKDIRQKSSFIYVSSC